MSVATTQDGGTFITLDDGRVVPVLPDGSTSDLGDTGTPIVTPDAATGPACVKRQSKGVAPAARHIVVLYDHSGSTSKSLNGGTAATPKDSVLEAFRDTLVGFANNTPTIATDLRIVPFGAKSQTCALSDYPALSAPVSLPAIGTIGTQVAGFTADGSSAVRAGLDGAYALALDAPSKASTDASIVLMLTDGVGSGAGDCNSTIATVNARISQAAQSGISTVVVGPQYVSSELQSYAMAGSASQSEAVLVKTGVATSVNVSNLEAAITKVSTTGSPCSFAIPSVFPDGSFASAARTGLRIQWGNGTNATLVQSPSCSDPNGYDFDSVSQPTRVNLCSNVCSTLNATPAAYAELLLGC